MVSHWKNTKEAYFSCMHSFKEQGQGYKAFFMLNSAENEICSAYKKLNTTNLNFFPCKAELSMKFFMLINNKMLTIVGILIFISRINFMLK